MHRAQLRRRAVATATFAATVGLAIATTLTPVDAVAAARPAVATGTHAAQRTAAAASRGSLVFIKNNRVWVSRVDGTHARAVTGASKWWAWPSESANGKIAVAGGAERVNSGGGTMSSGSSEVYAFDQHGHSLLKKPVVTPGSLSGPEMDVYVNHFRISPDGTRVAYNIIGCCGFSGSSTMVEPLKSHSSAWRIFQDDFIDPDWIDASADPALHDPHALGLTHNGQGFAGSADYAVYHDTNRNAGDGQGWDQDTAIPDGWGYQAVYTPTLSNVVLLMDDTADRGGTTHNVRLQFETLSFDGTNTDLCTLTLPAAHFRRMGGVLDASPSISADGTLLTWAQDDGIYEINISHPDDCNAIVSSARRIVAGGSMPYFGAAPLSPARSARHVASRAAARVAARTATRAFPGRNGAIAFTSTQDGGTRHIFVTTSGGARDLTGANSPAIETQPEFSPDGNELVFTRYVRGLPNTEIFVMRSDGTHRVELTDTGTGNSDPTWSPDGRSIAFVSARDGSPNIYLMRSDGTDVRQITHDSAGKSELAWSPTGDTIAFVREPAGGGDRDIYSVRTDGTGLRDLSNDPNEDDLEPAWSPDGTRLAYSAGRHPNGSVGADLWTMAANGSDQQPLQHEDNGYSDGAYPAWSPDGSSIAFTANNGTGSYTVWSVAAGGGSNAQVITYPAGSGNPVDQEVDWQAGPTAVPAPSTHITSASVAARHGRATFRFTAPGAVTYQCALLRDGHAASWSHCLAAKSYHALAPGNYRFEVRAIGPGGTDRTPAEHAFRVS